MSEATCMHCGNEIFDVAETIVVSENEVAHEVTHRSCREAYLLANGYEKVKRPAKRGRGRPALRRDDPLTSLGVRLHDSQWARVKAAAKARGCSRDTVLRELVDRICVDCGKIRREA